MSKRHQSSRRKSYGRRQHEVRERHERTDEYGASEYELDDRKVAAPTDRFAFADAASSRYRFAAGD
jgi:hypothetical protein